LRQGASYCTIVILVMPSLGRPQVLAVQQSQRRRVMQYEKPARDAQISVTLGRALPTPQYSAEDLLVFAAAGAAPLSRDIADAAVLGAASASGDLRRFTVKSFSAPKPGRKFSLAEVAESGRDATLRIARGDFRSILDLCGLDGEDRRSAQSLAERAKQGGYRPWAIAGARGPDGPWSLIGILPVRAGRPARGADRAEYLFVPIWSFLLRCLHWSWTLLITLLILTGLEIQTMYLSAGTTWYKTGFFFGYVRLAHLICGWLLTAVIVARIANALLTSNRYESWQALIPFKSRRDIAGFFEEMKNYFLLRNDEGKKYLSHDPMAQLSFTGVYLVMIGAIASGFALYGLYNPGNWFFALFEWIPRLFGANQVRLFHVAMMWLVILFVPIHIYLVIRADGYAREGSLSAMLSGGRWVRKGARFEDEKD
jgi:Ni/Fe-hydrogenase 1 B-type cytochrome subunit